MVLDFDLACRGSFRSSTDRAPAVTWASYKRAALLLVALDVFLGAQATQADEEQLDKSLFRYVCQCKLFRCIGDCHHCYLGRHLEGPSTLFDLDAMFTDLTSGSLRTGGPRRRVGHSERQPEFVVSAPTAPAEASAFVSPSHAPRPDEDLELADLHMDLSSFRDVGAAAEPEVEAASRPGILKRRGLRSSRATEPVVPSGSFVPGTRVSAEWLPGDWHPGSIVHTHLNGTYDVRFDDGDSRTLVPSASVCLCPTGSSAAPPS